MTGVNIGFVMKRYTIIDYAVIAFILWLWKIFL